MIRVRIAPSPTGYFHVGTARAALFNWLYARHNQGSFIIRIEDTDQERSKTEYEVDIINGLKWLGIDWDEGPDVGGEYGPYRQSERLELYSQALNDLEVKGMIYRCYCTAEELEQEHVLSEQLKRPYRYSGKCRNNTATKDQSFVYRFKTPLTGDITWQDGVRGEVTITNDTLDDFIIAKGLTEPLYNFAVVVDDHLMSITQVIRGEDHISNTPKQILVAQALGYKAPEFAHLPLILNSDRTKMSKRSNEVRLSWYQGEGYLPEAIINFLALLGWNPGTDQEIFSTQELITNFSLERVQKSGAIFNLEKLNWMNNAHLKKYNHADYLTSIKKYLNEYYPEYLAKFLSELNIDEILLIFQERCFILKDIISLTAFFQVENLKFSKELLVWPKKTLEELGGFNKIQQNLNNLKVFLESNINWDKVTLENEIKKWIKDNSLGAGEILWPMRISLSGEQFSPTPFELAFCYGKNWTIKRLEQAIQKLND